MTHGESLGEAPRSQFDRAANLIRVWQVRLDASIAQLNTLEKLLSLDETERAVRFHFDRDRRRFTVARAALRSILGGYLGERPEEAVFSYGPYGKPALSNSKTELRFNVSHSEELALVAVAQAREVGLDVEWVRPLADLEQLSAANFSVREVAAFTALQSHQRQAAFFAGWTRKEAYVKAKGGGFSIPPKSFSVSMAPDEPPSLLDVDNEGLESGLWSMIDLPVPSGYVGALVGEGADWRVDYANWSF